MWPEILDKLGIGKLLEMMGLGKRSETSPEYKKRREAEELPDELSMGTPETKESGISHPKLQALMAKLSEGEDVPEERVV
jgi:hypothetical protein